MIHQGATTGELQKFAVERGMITMKMAAM